MPRNVILTAVLLSGMVATANASPADQLHKLVPTDGEEGDIFGARVSLSGSTAVVASSREDENGLDAGAAYVFDVATGTQAYKLLPDDGAANDRFGISTDIEGHVVIVGSHFDDDFGNVSGSAYVFDAGTGQQLAKITPPDPSAGQLFGVSVALSGTTAVIGAVGDSTNGETAGAAYLYDLSSPSSPSIIAKLIAEDSSAYDNFGNQVAIDGSFVLIGASNTDNAGGLDPGPGSAYVFDAATGQELAEITPSDGVAGDRFGWDVAISGTTAVIGSRTAEFGLFSGSFYVFDLADASNPTEMLKVTAPGNTGGTFFAEDVAIDGQIIVASRSFDSTNGVRAGAAHLFDAITGEEITQILPDDGAPQELFSAHVAISDSTVACGAPGGTGPGSAYLFEIAIACSIADLDGSGTINFDDIDAFVNAYLAADLLADCDGSGVIQADDIECFVSAFLAGCS